MQSKLVFASLAAMAHKVSAVTSLLEQDSTTSIADTLIGYYANCNLSIDDFVGNTESLQDQMRLIPNFTFSGFDADVCPDMEGTVWLEPPSACASDPSCPAEGITIPITTAEIVNGPWSSTQLTGKVSGEWFAHVTITPVGFECALAMADSCTSIDVAMPCDAVVSGFAGDASINTANGQTAQYVGAAGLNHGLNWSVSDLWNCNLCATYSVADAIGGSTATASMTKSELISFSSASSNLVKLQSATSYYPLDYQLVLADCDSGDNYTTKMATDINPHPDCTVSCSVSIDNVQPNDEGTSIDITQTMTSTNSYTCTIAELSGDMTNGEFSQTVTTSTQVNNSYDASPATWEALVWANFPMNISQDVKINSAYLNAEMCTASDSYSFQPDCDLLINSHTMTAEIVEGAAWGEHKLQFTDKLDAFVGPYCPAMTATRELTRSGEKLYNQALSSDNVALFSTETNAGASAPAMVQSVDFNDGQWCSTFSLSGTDNSVMSASVCKQINAPACEITPETTFTGTLDTSNYMMSYASGASFTNNVWCNPASMTYDWTYIYEDQASTDYSTNVLASNYQQELVANNMFSFDYTLHESDYQICNTFDVVFTPDTFDTQDIVSQTANACFSHEQTCRPKFGQSPDITSFTVTNDLEIQFSLDFNTTGYQNCGEMDAVVQIYIDDPEVLVYNYTMDNAEVATYQNTIGSAAALGINLDSGCYRVKVTLGEVGKVSTTVSQTSGAACWWDQCYLSDATVSKVSHVQDAEGTSWTWTFDESVVQTEACFTTSFVHCVTVSGGTQQWCGAPNSNQVVQTGAFGARDFDYSVAYTSSNSTSSNAAGSNTYVSLQSDCTAPNDMSASVNFMTDTIKTVTIQQETDGASNSVCGTPQYKYQHDETNSTVSNLATHSWNLPSVTGDFTFNTYVTFSNYPDFEYLIAGVPANWIQGCKIQVDKVEFESFTRSVYVSETSTTSATATLFVNATSTGDCGSDYDIVATLTGEDGSSVVVPLDQQTLLSSAGQTTTVNIDRDEQAYTLAVSVTATAAPETVEQHQADTVNAGFINILADSASASGNSLSPVCNVEIESFEFGSYTEESDWTGPMLATYSGSIYAESACNNLAASIKFMDTDLAVYIVSAPVTLIAPVEAGSLVWTFEVTVSAPNDFGYYFGALSAFDGTNEADIDSMNTGDFLWSPPCYLDVVSFAKTAQDVSIDQLKAQLSYNIALAAHGSNACNSTTAVLTLANAEGTTFRMAMDNEDLESALDTYGFNMTVQIESAEATGATITMADQNAVLDASAPADGFQATSDLDCTVIVRDFCLLNSEEVSAGRYEFNFTIRVESNSQCGTLAASMDLIQDTTYLGHVEVDSQSIIDSVDCDCDNTFTITADYDGSAGDIYGQLDIRNAEHQIVQVTDSCVLAMPVA